MKKSLSLLTVLLASATFALAQSGDPAPSPVPSASPSAAEHGGRHGRHHGSHGAAGQFKQMDTDSDGFLSLEEFKASPMGQKKPGKAEKHFKKLDADNDGKVSPAEFEAGAGKHHGGKAK